MNIAFLGSNNDFSSTLFNLVVQQLPIASLIMPGVKVPQRRATPGSIEIQTQIKSTLTTEQLAQQAHIPIDYQGGKTSSRLADYIAAKNIDILIVACYPYLISEVVVAASTFGAINIHTSLLPKYRGPTPIFWQLRNNESRIGVSIHLINKRFDAGDILIQKLVNVPASYTCPEIESILALATIDMLLNVLMSKKTLQRYITNGVLQDEKHSSYFTQPQSPSDFYLSLDWPAAHAFRFMRGTQHWQKPYPIIVNNEKTLLSTALSFSNNPAPKLIRYEKMNIVNIGFKTGNLRATYLPQ
ncbi:MAG: methionyl-tRNA formyltransferase [Thiohalomonadales bacterium]